MKTNSGTDSSVSFVITPYVRCAIRSKMRFCHQWCAGSQNAMNPKMAPSPISVNAVG